MDTLKQRWIWSVGEFVYMSFAPRMLPPLLFRAQDGLPRGLRQPLHSEKDFPWMGYIPCKPRFQGELLGRLARSRSGEHIIRQGNIFLLDAKVADSWYRLERGLIRLALALSSKFKNFELYVSPCYYGYLNSHRNRETAERSIRISREAFVPLMAACSYIIDRWRSRGGESWGDYVHREHGVYEGWIKCLTESQVCDFTTPRVGSIVTTDCNWLDDVPMFLNSEIPLWFRWERNNPGGFSGTPVDRFKPPTFPPPPPPPDSLFRLPGQTAEPSPSVEIAPGATTLEVTPPEATPLETTPPTPSFPPTTHRVDLKFPALQRGSGQKPGEKWQDFMKRKENRRAALLVAESEKARHARLDRERAKESGACPGAKAKVRVWQWVVDPDSGIRVRTEIYRREWEDIWENYGQNQRIYDGFANEWDVCTEFDPSDEAPAPLWDDDDDGVDFPSIPYEQTARLEPSAETVYHDDLVTALRGEELNAERQWNAIAETVDSPSPHEKLENIVYLRYGFLINDEWADVFHDNSVPVKRIPLKTTRMVLVQSANVMVEEGLEDAIGNFVDCLCDRGHVPAGTWDISTKEHEPCFKPTKLLVKRIKLDNDDFYLIDSVGGNSQRHPPWRLVVRDAATVLECYRAEVGPDRTQVAHYLLSQGIPFKTLIPGPAPPRFPHIPPISRGLGSRASGYVPTLLDYTLYERDRASVVKGPYGRAALLTGGIVWRLARETLTDVTSAAAGPSDNVLEGGTAFLSTDGHLWDDSLSQHELDIICGVYKVRSGMQCLFSPTHTFQPTVFFLKGTIEWIPTPRGGRSTLRGLPVGLKSAIGLQAVRLGT